MDTHEKKHKNRGDKIPYGFPLKAPSLNIRGLNGENGIATRQHVTHVMKQEGIDFMLLTETQVNHSSTESHNDFLFFFSSDVKPDQNHWEYAEVGIVLHKKFKPYLYEVKQMNGRIMAIKLRSKGMNLSFVCCYAPHSGHSSDTKEDFYDSLQIMLNECPEAVFLGGDLNARLQYRYDSETDIMGPHFLSGKRAQNFKHQFLQTSFQTSYFP